MRAKRTHACTYLAPLARARRLSVPRPAVFKMLLHSAEWLFWGFGHGSEKKKTEPKRHAKKNLRQRQRRCCSSRRGSCCSSGRRSSTCRLASTMRMACALWSRSTTHTARFALRRAPPAARTASELPLTTFPPRALFLFLSTGPVRVLGQRCVLCRARRRVRLPPPPSALPAPHAHAGRRAPHVWPTARTRAHARL